MSEKKVVYQTKKGVKSTPGKRPKASKRRPLNRHEVEKPDDDFVSASAKKLKLSEDLYDVEVDSSFGYRILDFITVFSAIANVVVCKECKSEVKFTEKAIRGLGFKLVVSCAKCEKKEISSCPYIKNGYEINRRIVLAMRLLGVGLQGIKKFCAFMELPQPVYHSFYDKLIKNLQIATSAVCKQSILKAAQEEHAASIAKGKTNGLTVSGDGTWRKRGFSSLYGLVSLIGYYVGKVVDFEVKSKYCKACEYWNKSTDTEEYAEWAESHASECSANHEGSAGKMEVDAAIEMFQRSESLHKLKYANYIGDGDSKTFKGITDAKPYGPKFVIKKRNASIMCRSDWALACATRRKKRKALAEKAN